jgi:hypothetical protein
MPDQSALEHIARRTTALYNVLDAKGIDSIPQPGTEGSPQGQLARVCLSLVCVGRLSTK